MEEKKEKVAEIVSFRDVFDQAGPILRKVLKVSFLFNRGSEYSDSRELIWDTLPISDMTGRADIVVKDKGATRYLLVTVSSFKGQWSESVLFFYMNPFDDLETKLKPIAKRMFDKHAHPNE